MISVALINSENQVLAMRHPTAGCIKAAIREVDKLCGLSWRYARVLTEDGRRVKQFEKKTLDLVVRP